MNERKTDYPLLDLLRDRWSSRAMSGESLSHDELFSLFEAARWAQSSYNNQPWRFIYAERESPQWDTFLDLLSPPNKIWAHRADVLIVVISRDFYTYDDRYSRTHSFDAGAAAENLSLQGYSMGLIVHGMEGFDYDRAKEILAIPKEYTVEAMFAVGKPGEVSALPEELQKREMRSDRKPFKDFVFKGSFKEADNK